MFGRKRRNPGQRRPKNAPKTVFSYYSNRPAATNRPSTAGPSRDYEGYSSVPRARWGGRQWLKHLPSLIALLAVTFSVLYCLSLSSQPKVLVITGSLKSSGLRDQKDYQAGAEKILNRSVLNRTKFTINTQAFNREFKQEFPEVSDAAITLPLVSRRPIVTITTAQPAVILTSNNQAFVLDKRGTVIMPASQLSSSNRQSLPTVTDQSNLKIESGKTVLPGDYVEYIVAVLAQLQAKQVKAESLSLPNQAHQLDVKIAGQPYYIKFSFDTDAREATGSFLAVKQKLEQDKTVPSQYIDVRVVGRAYYQ